MKVALHTRASVHRTPISRADGRAWRTVRAGVIAGLAAALSGCGSRNEALAILEVFADADVRSFANFRLSVVDRPETLPKVNPIQVSAGPTRWVSVGYYLPGPSGRVRIHGEAVTEAGCVVGEGFADVDIEVGKISQAVSLPVASINGGIPVCPSPRDGGDGGGPDGSADDADADADTSDAGYSPDTAVDATVDGPIDAPIDGPTSDSRADAPTDASTDIRPDASTDVRPDATVPACFAAEHVCKQAAECCSSMSCEGTVSSDGKAICCSGFNKSCSRGEGCCGELDCVSSKCCLRVGWKCSANECCGGRICATNISNGTQKICCGDVGTACADVTKGKDCCGSLVCDSGTRTCRRP